MKLKKYIVLSILFIMPFISIGQNIKAGLIAGFNFSQIDGDGMAGYHKIGVNTGALALIKLKNNFSTHFELLFSQKGARSAPDPNFPVYRYFRFDYVDIPVLISYHDKKRMIFSTGIAVGTLIKYKRKENGEVIPTTPIPINKRDYNILADLQYMITDHWGANLRYAYSIVPIDYDPISNNNNFAVYNNVVSLRAVYLF